MACNMILKAIPYDCEGNLSGVKEIWYNDYNKITLGTVEAGVASVTTTEPFVRIEFAKNTASYTSTLTKNESQGTKYYNTELVANFNKLEAEKNTIFSGDGVGVAAEAGIDGGQLTFIVVDKNNKKWILGADDYATTTALTAQTGAGVDDGNFYTLTVTAQSGRLPYEISDETYATLTTPTNPQA